MSHMVGADVAELRELAAYFRQRAGQLQSIQSNLAWRIHSAPWHGSDVAAFKQHWDRSYRGIIQGAAQDLLNSATFLNEQADQQEAVSGSNGGSAAWASGTSTTTLARRAAEISRLGGGSLSMDEILEVLGEETDSAWYKSIRAASETSSLVADGSVMGWLLTHVVGDASHPLSLVEKLDRLPVAQALLRSEGDARPFSELSRFSQGLKVVDGVSGVAGAAGATFGVISLVSDLGEKKYVDAGFDVASIGVGTVGALAAVGLIAVPAAPLVIAGLAVGAAALIYDNRAAIGSAIDTGAKAAGKGIVAAAEWTAQAEVTVAETEVRAATTVIHAAGDAVQAAGNVASDVADTGKKFISNIIKKPSWAPW